MEKLKRYIKKTWKNKAVALLLIVLGMISLMIEDDCTALVFIMVLAVPLWFEKRNRIE